MAIDAETFRWLVGGYCLGLSVLTGVAYHDPKFYLEWLFLKLVIVSSVIYLVISSFWLGAKAVRDYVEIKLNFMPDQLADLKRAYDNGTDVLQWVLAGAVIAFFWTMILHSLSVERKRRLSL